MERLASINNMTIHCKAMVGQQELVIVPIDKKIMAVTIAELWWL